MREIIHVQVGQCGNQIGSAYWREITKDHALGLDGTGDPRGQLDVCFNEVANGKYVPRAVLVDLEPGVLDTCKSSDLRTLFNPGNYICGANGAGNNWAKGHYTEGAEIMDQVMDVIRRESENADCLQGFQLSQSLGGGTGSGLGTLLIASIREEYTDRIFQTFSVFPAPDISETLIEPYNTVLSVHQLVENTDAVQVIDNQALLDICTKQLRIKNPTFNDFNDLVARTMAGTTCSLRFQGQLNSDLRKMCVNLVPFPRLHFFLTSFAPQGPADMQGKHRSLSVVELTNQVFHESNMLCKANLKDGRFLTASVLYRGAVSTRAVEEAVSSMQYRCAGEFVDWIPNNVKTSVCDVSPEGLPLAATFVGNSTAIKDVFRRISEQFTKMFKRRAYLHWFTREGMDELEFVDAETNLNDLMMEYLSHQDSRFDEYYDDGPGH
eukprot:GHVH01004582.1.p1 GENE.GHVH01004582.1~~GHVH01004582.1.p1  ORF type:complete len:437 (+),score=50.60 GHVH01004582.1:78-1388(+)